MQHHRINPEEYPPKNGESWWVVHPNRNGCEFRVPMGAVSPCCSSIGPFEIQKAYSVISCDNHNGWVTLRCGDDLYDMPQYLFARHFDAEAFVVGTASPEELEKAKPFDYKPTVPNSGTVPVRFTDGNLNNG